MPGTQPGSCGETRQNKAGKQDCRETALQSARRQYRLAKPPRVRSAKVKLEFAAIARRTNGA